MTETLYRRPLPADATEFSSPAGRQLFAEALAAGGLDGYFRLAEQFHTQAEPEFCGLGSLVVALNALGIDPGRLWKGPWRWFSEELLDCCVSLDQVRRRGLDLDEVACLARCNGAAVELARAETSDAAAWRASLSAAARGEGVVIASYDRAGVDQTGSGHFSPIGGYHAARDLVLVLDVARFKYPPHWISAERLWQAMHAIDPVTGRSRGWLALHRRPRGISLGYTLRCAGDDLKGFARRLSSALDELGPAARLEELAAALLPIAAHLTVRVPTSTTHQRAIAAARDAVRGLPVFARIEHAVGADRAEAVTLLLFAVADRLAPSRRDELTGGLAAADGDEPLAAELANVRAQLGALWTITAETGAPSAGGVAASASAPLRVPGEHVTFVAGDLAGETGVVTAVAEGPHQLYTVVLDADGTVVRTAADRLVVVPTPSR
ncbi:MAG: phytochelatin synthase family protein [Myxococcota bacterium]|nr:phytochelatin synthase family protein [Myxococcota bacterium]